MTLAMLPRPADTVVMGQLVRKATKTCSRCGRRRPAGEFGRSDRYADGRKPHCMRCRVEINREWREANRDAFNEMKRAYEARPEVKARRRARDRKRRRIAA